MNRTRICDTGLRWLILSLITFFLDIISKILITHYFTLYQTKNIFPFLNITYVRNHGAAFSFLNDAGGWQKWLFSFIAVIIIFVLTYSLYKSKKSFSLSNLSFSLIIGGALGNLVDRIYNGFVVDFIHFHWGEFSFAVFNIADSAICIGAIFLIFDYLFGKKVVDENK